jgi:hypothetical protein
MSLGLNATFLKFCQILTTLKLYRQILIKVPIQNFTKIRPEGAELFHADGRRDMTKLPVVLRNYANAPTKYIHYKQTCVQKN